MATPPPQGSGRGVPVSIPLPAGMPPIQPGQRPTPEQIQYVQQKLRVDAEAAGMTVPEFIEQIRKQAAQRAQQQGQAQEGQGPPGQPGPGGPQGQQQPGGQGQQQQGQPKPHQHGPPQQMRPQRQAINPGPPKPEALAMAKFLRSQDLKTRTCILNGERRDMFRVKRALRALESPAYEKARKKNPLLPEIKDRASLENAFKLLPLSMLALRVKQIDPPPGPNGKKAKRVKGQWNVKIEQQQEAGDDMYYAWLYEGSQVKRQLYAALALVAIFAVVLYPLWPLKLRLGVYYLSWGMLGLLGLFFLMAIFRVILFCITYFAVPPGLWLYPNLWEDVSFMDSFRPVWAWHETEKPKKKKKSKAEGGGAGASSAAFAASTGQPAPASATTTGTDTQVNSGEVQQRSYVAPKVEEDGNDDA
ncbi:Translocation protein-like protein [Emericellopsis cladophorae]|uniref:Translocation protein SEC62 n=1 Tax=Emericellopsis cladophorae TaxID=2686198 RepID=A0A9Q0BHV0_9HYPO|nr:Translocation protein-like protein [Emericellopsis cladophorae]KAI6785150.1 Translocation protein-like protein [Emericellopsis cladophorae]